MADREKRFPKSVAFVASAANFSGFLADQLEKERTGGGS